jgi:hypothetical protein
MVMERHFGLGRSIALADLVFVIVMPGLVPGIHVFTCRRIAKTWMAGTSPAMTALK